MKNIFKAGDIKTYAKTVQANETAKFESGEVHPVYSTFALARDAEWCCRLFVLEMKEADEEGIGTMVSVYHHSPAAVGEEMNFTAVVKSIEKNEITCTWEARCNNRLVATGEQGQKIIKKEKLEKLFNNLGN